MKTLILTEKPSVARDFANALKVTVKGDGYFESETTIITWAIGHLMELKEPDEYDKKWKSWNINSLPILPPRLQYKPNSRTKKQLSVVLKQIKRKDISRIVLATDAGREGELIGRTLINEENPKVALFRFWTSQALSRAVINENMERLKPLSDYDRLYFAGRCRQSADWLVGMNLSRLATIRMGELFSVGRVQTAVLALLVNRRHEIDKFVGQPYFVINGKFKFAAGELSATWFNSKIKSEETHINTEVEAQKILDNCKDQEVYVNSVNKENKRTQPPQLFSLTELQKTANRLYGFSAKHTLNIAQALYEKNKCLSYPRTDAKVLGTKSFEQARNLINEFKSSHSEYFQFFDSKKLSLSNQRVFDDEKLTDHHALIPLKSVNLSGDEGKIFELVLKRFIMVFSRDFEYEETKIFTEINGENFKSKGQQITCLGWKFLSGGDKEQFLPNINKDEKGLVKSIKSEKKITKPPPEYTEATLLQDMINPSRLVTEKEFKKAFRGEVGLGTQATRAQIIETLLMRKYIHRKAKNLLALPRGLSLIGNLKLLKLSQVLTCPAETAKWELELEQIAQGQGDARKFMLDIRGFVSECTEEWRTAKINIVKTIESTKSANSKGNIKGSIGKKTSKRAEGSVGECPLCQSAILDTPKSFGCEKWREGCKFKIWKKIAGKKISKSQAIKILSKGKSDEIKGFKSKAGKIFSASLTLKGEGVSFEFKESRPNPPGL